VGFKGANNGQRKGLGRGGKEGRGIEPERGREDTSKAQNGQRKGPARVPQCTAGDARGAWARGVGRGQVWARAESEARTFPPLCALRPSTQPVQELLPLARSEELLLTNHLCGGRRGAAGQARHVWQGRERGRVGQRQGVQQGWLVGKVESCF
jgi:hypothetical protein